MRRQFGQPRNRWKRRLFVCFGFLLILIIGFGLRIRPVIHTMALYHGKMVAVQMIHQAVEGELSGSSSSAYQDLVLISRNQDNAVTSLQINMVQANRLKSRVTAEVLKKLATIDEEEIALPLGTFLGSQLFLGHGPAITLQLLPSGYVETQFENQFESAGINQTLHQVMLTVTTRITASVPGYTAAADISTNFIVAQTLINGTVPEAYLQPGQIAQGLTNIK